MWMLLGTLLATVAVAQPVDDVPDDELFGDDELDEPVPLDPTETEAGYRALAEALATLPPDEEIEAWSQYLRDHPESAFRSRIQRRIETLMDQVYERAPAEEVVVPDTELRLAQGVLMVDFDPRTRVKVGFQWGLPELLDLFADYEHALHRQLSVHGGIRNRLSGWSFEAGARFAPVKSQATGTIVSLVLDGRYNLGPAFPAVRPVLAGGQRVGRFDLALQAGADVELREGGSPTWLAAGNVTFDASERVRVFAEANVAARHLGWPGGSFHFDTVGLGIEFLMAARADRRDAITADLGAWVPWFYRWWAPAHGAAFGRVDVHPADLR